MQNQPNTNKSTERSLNDLKELIALYGSDFEAWTKSDYCDLNTKEIEVINSYLEHQTHQAYAIANYRKYKHVASVFAVATRKLRSLKAQQKYGRWRELNYLQNNGLFNGLYDLNSIAFPINEYLVDLPKLAKFIKANNTTTDNKKASIHRITKLDYDTRHDIRKTHLCIHFYVALE